MADEEKDITVMISTYNRAGQLKHTLESMTGLDTERLQVEYVIINNNSSDNTEEVVKAFEGRLPLRYLFEGRPGKSKALNYAVETVALGRIVVLTDDDVGPREDWLQAINRACQRHPDYSVFGGKVEPAFPEDMKVPDWAKKGGRFNNWLTRHDLGDEDRPYVENEWPLGPNYWVRREVFEKGARFDENVGAMPGNFYTMGDETVFLVNLASMGFRPMYAAEPYVDHYLQPIRLTAAGIRQRSFRTGRGRLYLPAQGGLPRKEQFEKNPWVWRLSRGLMLIWYSLRYGLAMAHPNEVKRLEMTMHYIYWIGFNLESIKLSMQQKSG